MKKTAFVVVLIVAGLIAAGVLLTHVPCTADLTGCVDRAGAWGPVLLTALYIVFSVLLIPASIPTVMAGFLFGMPLGSATALAGSMLGAIAAFVTGRTVARRRIARRLARNRRLVAVDAAIGRHGFKLVLLSRLSPMSPFVVLNYVLGLTTVSFRQYVLGSLLGMIPGTLVFVYLGAALRSLTEPGGTGPNALVQGAYFWTGLAATAVLAVLLGRLARRALNQTLSDNPAAIGTRA